MIQINKEVCIGCGLCITDCFPNNIVIYEGKAKAVSKCMECGHCIAVCPQNAVTMDTCDMSEIEKSSLELASLDPDRLLRAIKGRRSVRHFKHRAIEDDKIAKIIEAGRYTPTGSNRQENSYIVVRNDLSKLTKMALISLKNIAQNILIQQDKTQDRVLKLYAKRWIAMCDNYSPDLDGCDNLFFHAPAIVLVVGDSPIDGGLAASNMELMTFAQGLGMFYSGFFVRAAKENSEIKKFLEISKEREVLTCLVMGYPDVQYYRSVPRKKAKVIWK